MSETRQLSEEEQIVDRFTQALAYARMYGLEFEVVQSFFADVEINMDKVDQSIAHACYEWDI